MPKVLVLFDSGDQGAERLAESAAEGAKRVRFTEVDVRVVGADASTADGKRRLDSSETVEQYDGVVVVGSDREPSAAIDALLAGRRGSPTGKFIDRVFAAVSGADINQRLSELGGIMIGVPAGSSDPAATARNIGERVAKVSEWVRHALSHEHGHSQHSHSQHQHSH